MSPAVLEDLGELLGNLIAVVGFSGQGILRVLGLALVLLGHAGKAHGSQAGVEDEEPKCRGSMHDVTMR